METEPTFRNDSEAAEYWKNLAMERQADFDELQEMNADYEREMESQIERSENEKTQLQIQNARLLKELEDSREKQRHKDASREEELERLKTQFETENRQKLEFSKLNRTLEQELDDYDRKYRQLHTSYEQSQELLQIETERNAMLETDVSEKTNLVELIQRLKDEKRDLKSEIEVREKLTKREKPKEIINEEPPSDLENRCELDGASGVALPRRKVSLPLQATSTTTLPVNPAPDTNSRSPHPNSPHHSTITSPSPSMSSIHSNSSSQSRLSALSIVGDLLRKVGALETKLASCRTFVRDNSSTIPNPAQVSTTPRRAGTHAPPGGPSGDSLLHRTSGEPRSPLRNTSGAIYNSPAIRTSASFSTPPRRGSQQNSAFNSSPHESRIGERLANQRALFPNGAAMTNGERLPNSKSIKLNAP